MKGDIKTDGESESKSKGSSDKAQTATPDDDIRIPKVKFLTGLTAVNVALVFGGALFMGAQISSIQDRAEKAEATIRETSKKIEDANHKNDLATRHLENAEIVSQLIEKRLDKIAADFEEKQEELLKDSEIDRGKISKIQTESEEIFDSLKGKQKNYFDSIDAYVDGADAKNKATLNRLSENWQSAVAAQEKTLNSIKGEINQLREESEEAKLEVRGLRKSIDDRIANLENLENQLTDQLSALMESGKVPLSTLFQRTDIWVKLLLFGFPAAMLLLGCFWGIVWKWWFSRKTNDAVTEMKPE